MSKDYVTKVYSQKTSLVTNIPKAVREKLELTKHSNLLWQVDENSCFVQICKVVPMGGIYAKSRRNRYRKDQGGRT